MSTAMTLVPLHLGPLHQHEQLLTVVLAFGPFVLLAVVIAVRRRQDAALDDAEAISTRDPVPDPGTAARVEPDPDQGQRER